MTQINSDHTVGEDPLQFEIEVLASDATQEDIDRLTRNLLSELRETDVESVGLVSRGTAPKGSKGDPVTIGTLAMTAMPLVLPGVIELVKDWVARGPGRKVKFKGKGIEFEGSPEDLERILATLNRGKKKK